MDLFVEPWAVVQGIVGLIDGQERQCAGTGVRRRQFLEVAGSVLLDVEMTIKLLSQGKVGVAVAVLCVTWHHCSSRS